ncbi:MAG: CPBP family intramembrane glutamic endopeptidase [Actinomycetota bacterium]
MTVSGGVRAAPYKLDVKTATILTLLAGLLGLPTLIFDFPSIGLSLVEIGWKIATVTVMIVAIRKLEHGPLTAETVGLTPVAPKARNDRTAIALPAIIGLTLIAMFWAQIPGLKSLAAAGSASSYEAGTISGGLLLFELLGRYPMQVVAEEVFFRGYMQPRLTVAAPVLGGVLFALYHLQQWQTIPSLIPLGIALGLLRWWLGSIWPGVAFHYLGNAMFILSLR